MATKESSLLSEMLILEVAAGGEPWVVVAWQNALQQVGAHFVVVEEVPVEAGEDLHIHPAGEAGLLAGEVGLRTLLVAEEVGLRIVVAEAAVVRILGQLEEQIEGEEPCLAVVQVEAHGVEVAQVGVHGAEAAQAEARGVEVVHDFAAEGAVHDLGEVALRSSLGEVARRQGVAKELGSKDQVSGTMR